MTKTLIIALSICVLSACSEKKIRSQHDSVIANGQMPNLVKDKANILHLVYGFGDSIMYSYSNDQGGSFSQPSLIAMLPKLAASHSRGPQIAATNGGLIVLACNSAGDIFSYHKVGKQSWAQSVKVNDEDTVAKENLMALSGQEQFAFAVWLDVRGTRQNKIYGAKSSDGGISWSKNIMIYTSPDTTVCQCCKPSIAVKGNDVYIMFRNWLNGNRDMYLIQSKDGGNTFGRAQKLGNGNWELNGCPMDGGSLVVNNTGAIQTVWRREGKVYSSIPGLPEKEIGEGKGCTMETINGKNVYAWTENGVVVIKNSKGEKKLLGKGSLPVLKAINNELVICIWENEKQIHTSVIKI